MKNLSSGDFTKTEVVTHRKFVFDNTSDYVSVLKGREGTRPFYEDTAEIYEGVYTWPFFRSVKQQFYTEPYRRADLTIHNAVNVLQISQNTFDEKVQEGSVKITDTTLSETFIDDSQGNLVVSSSGQHVGNVFYEFGTIVTTDTSSYADALLGNFEVEYRATYRVTEVDIRTTIEPGEFNTSTNPTAIMNGQTEFVRPSYTYQLSEVTASYDGIITSQSIIPEFFGYDPSGSLDEPLTPHLTTIGYYNDNFELLATAKLSQPVPIPRDFPITIRATIDL